VTAFPHEHLQTHDDLLLGTIMPGLGVIARRLLGARVPPSARADLSRPARFPPWLAGSIVVVPVMTLLGIGIQAVRGQPYGFGDVGARLLIGVMWPQVAALLIGLAWGFRHLPPDWIGLKSQGAWFRAQSGGRTIVAILYHFGITSSAILLGNQVAFADARFSFLGNVAGAAVVASVAVAAAVGLVRRDRGAARV
jgi:hypothetical protein